MLFRSASDGVLPQPAGPDGLNGEFDTPVDPRYPTFVASNLSEALPGPFSPASASSTVRGFQSGGVSIARRLRLRGTAALEVGARSIGVFAHRLHAGVTATYYMADAMPGTNPDSLNEQFFGRVAQLGERRDLQHSAGAFEGVQLAPGLGERGAVLVQARERRRQAGQSIARLFGEQGD